MSESNTFYVSTPIYYPSDKLHIGHSYTTVAADCLARYKRMTGYDVMFLTGTDEHGQKIERKAQEWGQSPQEFVDGIVTSIKELWETLDITHDDFIRTTETRHKRIVQQIFQRFYEQGDIYKDVYEGWYCTPCESFWLERQLEEEKACPDCGRAVEWVKEESYFFRMSKYADQLLDHIEKHPEFIQPESRKNEMINNFLKPGLEDLCVSRTTFKWGIEVPMDPDHVVYVWLDALTNYITALGYLSEDDRKFKKFWPCDVHLVGKEIVRFHTIYWPIFLMALDLPLPKQVFGHGWLLLSEGKMSKSKGNVVDPVKLVSRYGSDAIRYYLLREIPFGSDGVFTLESLIHRTNYDLANDLGNLLHRTLAMIDKYFEGSIPSPGEPGEADEDLIAVAEGIPGKIESHMDGLDFSEALKVLWELVKRTNKYIDETEPWLLGKDEAKKNRLGTVLYNLAESLRHISILIYPFAPRTRDEIWRQLGIASSPRLHTYESIQKWGGLEPGIKIQKGSPLFPRLDVAEEVELFNASMDHEAEPQDSQNHGVEEDQNLRDKSDEAEPSLPALKEQIDIKDFGKLDIRVAEITSCEPVEGADKLLKLTVDIGFETRQVVAGLRKDYEASDLIGKKVLFLANLKPAKLKGVRSEGMVLAATDEETGAVVLPGFDTSQMTKGSRVT